MGKDCFLLIFFASRALSSCLHFRVISASSIWCGLRFRFVVYACSAVFVALAAFLGVGYADRACFSLRIFLRLFYTEIMEKRTCLRLFVSVLANVLPFLFLKVWVCSLDIRDCSCDVFLFFCIVYVMILCTYLTQVCKDPVFFS